MRIIIHTDGGARGNPGPAGVGVVIEDASGKVITQIGKTIGNTTNNVAEYTAVIEALGYIESQIQATGNQDSIIRESSLERIEFFLDSTLVVNQLNGLYKVKLPHLRELLLKVRMLEQSVGGKITYQYIPREENSTADALVNKALDGLI